MKQLKPRRGTAGDEEAAAGVVVPLTPRKEDYCCWSWSSWCLLKAFTLLLVLLTGVLIGFAASANISRYYYYTLLTTSTTTPSTPPPSLISTNSPTPPSTIATKAMAEQQMSQPFMSFVHPGSPEGHSMTDAELFWRASMVPRVEEYPYQRVPKVAFLFLTRGPLPFARLWERFFRGHEGLYSVYVHALPEYVLNVSATSPFHGPDATTGRSASTTDGPPRCATSSRASSRPARSARSSTSPPPYSTFNSLFFFFDSSSSSSS